MRIVFYDCGFETFGVQYLISAVKKSGHEPYLFFDSSFSKDYLALDFFLTDALSLSPKQACAEILAYSPAVVCFSLYTLFYQDNLKVIRLLKQSKPDIVIICGGFHASLLPHIVLENNEVDFVIIGEAEFSLVSLLDTLKHIGKDKTKALPKDALPGVWNMYDGKICDRGLSPIPHDLDSLEFPEKELYYRFNPSLSKIYTIIASRGCPYLCTYCNSATMNTLYRQYGEHYHRTRSVYNVITELEMAKEKYKPSYIMFFDDVFGSKQGWLQEFAQQYRTRVGLPYYCQTSPLIHNEESLQLLAESGCCLLELGFQSANSQVRQEILNRRESNTNMEKLILLANRKGIFTELDLIFHLPGENKKHITEALDFVQKTRPKWVNVAFLQFHPKTTIIDIALDHNMLNQEKVVRIEQGMYAFSMRLVVKSGLGKQYRILLFQMFFASLLPKNISSVFIRWVEKPLICDICSFCISPFHYLSRILLSYTDKRDFLIRHHVLRSLYAARWVTINKFSKYARLKKSHYFASQTLCTTRSG